MNNNNIPVEIKTRRLQVTHPLTSQVISKSNILTKITFLVSSTRELAHRYGSIRFQQLAAKKQFTGFLKHQEIKTGHINASHTLTSQNTLIPSPEICLCQRRLSEQLSFKTSAVCLHGVRYVAARPICNTHKTAHI